MYTRQHKPSGKHSQHSDLQSFGLRNLDGRSQFLSQPKSEEIASQYKPTPDLQLNTNEDDSLASYLIDGSIFSRQVDRPKPPGLQMKLQTVESKDKEVKHSDSQKENSQKNQLENYINLLENPQYDVSLLSDAKIQATEDYKYLEGKYLKGKAKGPEATYSKEEILLACRLALRDIQQHPILTVNNYDFSHASFLPSEKLEEFLPKAHR